MRAVVTPPPAPAAPGAFDFQRYAFFKRIGGVGFALGPAEIIGRTEAPGLAVRIDHLRQRLATRIRSQLGGTTGAVAAALMTGDRGAIPETVMTSIRDAGLAHLLAISGLHIGLVAGVVFVSIRAGLALLPAVALRFPIKKWLAAVALLAAFAFALIAGATVPTQRAFLMIGLVLLAVLLDRRALTMRPVAWAAVVILTLQPESLLSAGFQMSFAAVTALVAAYEALREAPFLRPASTLGGRAARYLVGVALSTLIAGAATAPFAVFHFNRFADYGLAANMLAVPITALWIMPWPRLPPCRWGSTAGRSPPWDGASTGWCASPRRWSPGQAR